MAEVGDDPRFLEREWLRERWTSRYTMQKRVIDLLFSIPLLIIAAISFPFIVLAIKLDSRGPVFYYQERVGKDGECFSVIKFRSMVADAERGGARFASADDARITRVGVILRGTRLDELPQIINVLRGEMALVGPRPERPHVIEQVSAQVPLFAMRTVVRPGLTGWAQVKSSYAANETELAMKLEYDLYYIRNASIGMDLSVLFHTALVVLRFKGV